MDKSPLKYRLKYHKYKMKYTLTQTIDRFNRVYDEFKKNLDDKFDINKLDDEKLQTIFKSFQTESRKVHGIVRELKTFNEIQKIKSDFPYSVFEDEDEKYLTETNVNKFSLDSIVEFNRKYEHLLTVDKKRVLGNKEYVRSLLQKLMKKYLKAIAEKYKRGQINLSIAQLQVKRLKLLRLQIMNNINTSTMKITNRP